MNETSQAKINRFKFIVLAVLLAWAVGGTVAGICFYNKYVALRSVVDEAGGSELVELVESQRDTIVKLQNNNAELRRNVESAVDDARELRTERGRIAEIAQRSDDRLAKFENTVDDTTDIIERLERRQYRIDELVAGIKEDNRQLRMELGLRP